ncbi:hypothetical protein C0J52_09792 [Blattella germanica]|nr:hypothetical protein C0J52_09792 [Blattella germanica]
MAKGFKTKPPLGAEEMKPRRTHKNNQRTQNEGHNSQKILKYFSNGKQGIDEREYELRHLVTHFKIHVFPPSHLHKEVFSSPQLTRQPGVPEAAIEMRNYKFFGKISDVSNLASSGMPGNPHTAVNM